ncbi:MAG: gamma-glutamyltransferase [Actinomycetota bacterium]|nr:gamma-glutamyltransferase [Actinomycetota bacterium]
MNLRAYGVGPVRASVVAAETMVVSTHAIATQSGLRVLDRGGNAADAALAAAATLSVVEPMSSGLGGDAFAIVRNDGYEEGLDAAGPAPAAAARLAPVPETGPQSVTVPGALAGWSELADRHARFGLDAAFADAIDLAERGFALGTRTADAWTHDTPCPDEIGPRAPVPGDVIRLPALARALRLVAENGPDVFYRGPIAEAVAEVSWLDEADLAGYRAKWIKPLAASYRGLDVLELPPPTQGIAALESLALLDGLEPSLSARVTSVALAVEDAVRHVRDGADVTHLLEPVYIQRRRRDMPSASAGPLGGTAYVGVVDGDGMAVSLIQSLYWAFGSGLAVPGTGIILQNRGACFAVAGAVEPGKRPYHTIMPSLLLQDGDLLGVLGVVGGFMQPQAHAQIISALVDEGLDAQAALDAPRFRVSDGGVALEPGLWSAEADLARSGHATRRVDDEPIFGTGSLIVVQGDALFGGADSRGDGAAAGS